MNPDFLKLTPVVFLLRDDTSQLTVHLQSFITRANLVYSWRLTLCLVHIQKKTEISYPSSLPSNRSPTFT